MTLKYYQKMTYNIYSSIEDMQETHMTLRGADFVQRIYEGSLQKSLQTFLINFVSVSKYFLCILKIKIHKRMLTPLVL